MSAQWIAEPDLRDMLGRECAEAILRGLAGQSLYVPSMPRGDHPLARLGGLRAMAVLCDAFGGERIALPSGRLGARKHSIKSLLADGFTRAEIAARLRVTERYVYKVAAAIKRQDSDGGTPPNTPGVQSGQSPPVSAAERAAPARQRQLSLISLSP